jgi:hypothetical protein
MLSKYRMVLTNMDLGQLKAQVSHLLDHLEAGKVIDWPTDETIDSRPERKRFSVGPVVPAKPEKTDIKYRPDGSIASCRGGG